MEMEALPLDTRCVRVRVRVCVCVCVCKYKKEGVQETLQEATRVMPMEECV
jgi:hypothetical protein